jgi:phenylpropionate dioxygenase-like ring-hydroxylating dioxygenase large terminal subunit
MNAHLKTDEPPISEDIAGLGVGPIPAGPYYQRDYFELEREAVFKRTWINTGHMCELPEPGSFIVRQIEAADASILITRGKDDKVRAFHNVCTHRGTQLVAEESGRKSSFTCRYHAWNFGADGALRSAPDFDRFYVDKSECGLPLVSVEVCAGLIFVNLDPAPEQSLREFLGPIADQFETLPVARATGFAEWVYEMDANWKLIWDNFQENYHLRFIHPKSGAFACGEDNPFGYALEMGFEGPHRFQTIWTNPATKPQPSQAVAFGRLNKYAADRGLLGNPLHRQYYSLFPNFSIVGSPANNFSHVVTPLSENRSRGVFRLYWVGDEENASERFAREFAMISTMEVHAEDTAVIEAGQRGLESGALKHIHFQSQEVLCRHFFQVLDGMVQAYGAQA